MNRDDPLALARECATHMLAADTASRKLGIEIDIPAPGSAEATMTVTEDMINGHALCHGGYIFTLADSAFAFACNAYNRVSVAASATVDFFAPARAGDRLRALAVERHRGRRSGTYDVDVTNQDGVRVAVFRGRSVALDRPLLDSPS